MEHSKHYFPGLHALRFFAALGVFAMHVEYLKANWGLPSVYMHPVVYEIPRTFVTLFFVLSGFLITYLLLTEKEQKGKIAIRKFYLRRMLRIWPLYFLVVALSFFVFPHIEAMQIPYLSVPLPEDFTQTLLLFLLFLPQLALTLLPPVPFAEPAWSIGVEEQFYIIWPIIIRYSKKLLRAILIFIGVMYLLKLAAYGIQTLYAENSFAENLQYFRTFLYFNRLECIAIGAIAGYIVFAKKEKWLAIIYHPIVQTLALISLAVLFATGYTSHIVNHTVYAALYSIVILNVSTNPKSFLKLENAVLRYLGKISFGIYMLHEIAIQLSIYYLQDFYYDPFATWYSNATLYAVSFGGTIALATVSYYGFERVFLKLKAKHSVLA